MVCLFRIGNECVLNIINWYERIDTRNTCYAASQNWSCPSYRKDWIVLKIERSNFTIQTNCKSRWIVQRNRSESQFSKENREEDPMCLYKLSGLKKELFISWNNKISPNTLTEWVRKWACERTPNCEWNGIMIAILRFVSLSTSDGKFSLCFLINII